MRVKKNKLKKKPLLSGVSVLFLVFVAAVTYIWLQISLVQMGYKIKKEEISLSQLKDEREKIEFKLSKMESPKQIQKLLAAANLNLKISDNPRLVRVNL